VEVLCRIPGARGIDVREEFQRVLFSGLDGRLPSDYEARHIAEELSWKLVPKERHRRFEFPPGPYYKLRYYEDSLGLVIQHDLSEGTNEQEAIENIPTWILSVLQAIERLAYYQRETTKEVKELKDFQAHQQRPNINDNAKNVTR
jgi:hypothetical protein